MPNKDLTEIPWEMWWIFGGAFLFGLLLPYAAAQGVLKVWASFRKVKINEIDISFWKLLVLGWGVLIPVYVLSCYYFNFGYNNA